MGHICNDYGDNPACEKDADEAFTMRFDDIGEPPLYWCAKCGAVAKAMDSALTEAFATRGPEFAAKFEEALLEQEAKRPTVWDRLTEPSMWDKLDED